MNMRMHTQVHMGKETCKKLQDLGAAAKQAKMELGLAEELHVIEKVCACVHVGVHVGATRWRYHGLHAWRAGVCGALLPGCRVLESRHNGVCPAPFGGSSVLPPIHV
jgi:hypothetical protein